jgi:tetratricopeptide (TPR) repeat protein
MKSVGTIAVVLAMAGLFAMAMFVSTHGSMESSANDCVAQDDQNGHDRQLSDRLIRFGHSALERGKIAEAKHFFQKAITVDPSHALAWKKYNMALLALVYHKVENDPGFLPDFESSYGVSNAPQPTSNNASEDDDGC